MEARLAAQAAGITSHTWGRFWQALDPLRHHHVGMWEHTIRVGLYAYGIAAHEGWPDTALPFMGGCGHDLGKVRIPCSLLDKVGEPLTEIDWALIHRHPEDSYLMLRDEFPLTAMVAGLHHAFTPRAYGIDLTAAPPWLQAAHTHKVVEATMVVMVADTFDAMTTRRNASTAVDPDDLEAVAAHMGERYGDWPERVRWLAEHLIS